MAPLVECLSASMQQARALLSLKGSEHTDVILCEHFALGKPWRDHCPVENHGKVCKLCYGFGKSTLSVLAGGGG